MAFTIPEGLHADLNPLAWMIGTWRGKGRGEYDGVEPFEFAQEVVFNHDGRNFMSYYSRSWILDSNGDIIRPGASETGFWRVKEGNVLEVLISHNIGITEGWLGRFDGPKIQLAMDASYSTPTAKQIDDGSRLYGLVEGELFFAYDMAWNNKPLQAHLWSTLERQAN
jgi:hypothetical protein